LYNKYTIFVEGTMRFVQYVLKESTPAVIQLGVKLGDQIVQVSGLTGVNFAPPTSLLSLLQSEDANLIKQIKEYATNETTPKIPIPSVTLTSPILNPDKVICIGMNYKDHCEEQNVPVPIEPIIFSKFASSIAGPFDPIPYPKETKELDFEVELAFVIGKKGKNIKAEDAMSHVFGYTVAHDVSARDWQLKKNGGQWLLGKAMEAFAPLGPEIVTADELEDPHNLSIRCLVNNEVVQDSNTSQMVHRVDGIITFISRFLTLLPGDIILTGTPPGVGVFRKPPMFLKVGDTVECSIEKIGAIKNVIVE
jgi:2-keto-4-pentenoate hydratase/2-oxohepta-3-ene-1,7-dioic acid hydratase in catechol pathway